MKRKLLLLSGLLALLLALSLAAPVSADTNRYVDWQGACAGSSPCYTTISAAVAASGPGDTIYVFPGTYAESVDLSTMATPGNITLITVDASGTPTPGTATVSPGTGPAIFNSVTPFPGNVTIDGFNVTSPDDDGINLDVNSDVVIARVHADNADGIGVAVFSDTGSVTVTSSWANYNGKDGFVIFPSRGDVSITGCSADENGRRGFYIDAGGGDVSITGCSADGNGWEGFYIDAGGGVSINLSRSNGSGSSGGFWIRTRHAVIIGSSSANGNKMGGFYIDAGWYVSITGCSADGNSWEGFCIDAVEHVISNLSSANENGYDGFWINAGDTVTIVRCSANGNLDPTDGDGFQIAAGGNVTITDSSAEGNAQEGIDVEKAGGNLTLSNCSATGNGDFGFEVENVAGNVSINPSSANSNGVDGFNINIDADKDVSISGSSANGNGQDGFSIRTYGKVTISGSGANGNSSSGFDIGAYRDVSISGSSANENGEDGFFIAKVNATISNSSANGNTANGFHIVVEGDVSITGSSAHENSNSGFKIGAEGNVTIQDSHIRGNGEDGVGFTYLVSGGTYLVNSSIICDNAASGLRLGVDVAVNAEGNWWGDASGPSHPNNPGGTGDAIIDGASGGSGTVDFEPWIDTITHSAMPDPVTVGKLTTVRFQFSGGGGAVFLGLGPGDPNGIPPFILSTDNGSLIGSTEMGTTVHEFINKPNGILSVTLLPNVAGTAVVSLDGPCNLDDSITITVEAPAPIGVGGEAYPVNKIAVIAPWLALLAAIIAGATIVLRRRRAQG